MLMGTPYERGNSDVIRSMTCDTAIEEGLAVAYDGASNVKAFDGDGTLCGIAGLFTSQSLAVVACGLRVWVQVDTLASAVEGAQVAFGDDGKATAFTTSGSRGTNAVFTGRTSSDGMVSNTGVIRKNQVCAEINFEGGL